MKRNIVLGVTGTSIISVSLAWDCSDPREREVHPWCDHGCCFEKDPVRCCTWAESMGDVFWTLVGLGSGFLVLSIIVGIVCCFRKKKGSTGQILSTNSTPTNDAHTSLGASNELNNSSRPIRSPQNQQHSEPHALAARNQQHISSDSERPPYSVDLNSNTSSNVQPRTSDNTLINDTELNFSSRTNVDTTSHSYPTDEPPPSYESLFQTS